MQQCYQCFAKYEENNNICPHCGYDQNTAETEPRYLKPGILLGQRYLVGIALGAGGFGVTYAAWDNVLNQRVAIKEYLPGEFSTRGSGQTQVTVYGGEKTEQFRNGKEKFHEESKRLARFRNITGIVQIYDSFEENGTVYIVMEYLEGETLGEKLKREERLSEQESLEIMLPVLHALSEVHKEGILHRDIAPNNIFLTKDGEVKLLDFGAARSATGNHSKSLTVLYKEGYTPEEQYRSRGDQGSWTDVYACAATLYRMLTGTVPLGAMERRVKDTLKKPSKAGAKVSHNVDVAIMNALNVDAGHRTGSAEDFLQELTGGKAKSHYVRTEEQKEGVIPRSVKRWSVLVVGGIAIFEILLATGIINIPIPSFASLFISQELCRVPNMINYDLETAKSIAQETGISLVVDDVQFIEAADPNKVISQEVAAGELVKKNSELKVVISGNLDSMTLEELWEDGIEAVAMPEAISRDRDEVIYELICEGIEVDIIYKKTDETAGNIVLDQDPQAGTIIQEGDKAILTVADSIVDWTNAGPLESNIRDTLNRPSGDIYASELYNIDKVYVVIENLGSECDVSALKHCLGATLVSIYPENKSLTARNVTGLENLKTLYKIDTLGIRYMEIDNLDFMREMEDVTTVELTGSEISDSSALWELKKIKNLDVIESNIELGNVQYKDNLTFLGISANQMERIEDWDSFKNLEYLYVLGRTDESCIEKINALPNLKEVQLVFILETTYDRYRSYPSIYGTRLASIINQLGIKDELIELDKKVILHLDETTIEYVFPELQNEETGDYIQGIPIS